MNPRGSHWAVAGMVLALAPGAWATDISGVQYGALDTPRIHGIFRLTPTGDPISDTGGNGVYDVQAYLDTGTSGILLSQETAQALGIDLSQYNGTQVTFSDIGVGGSEDFGVSGQYYISTAAFHSADYLGQFPVADYGNTFGQVRTQISLQAADPFISEPLDIFGAPAMVGKVVVFDPKPTNAADFMSAYIYAPGTPYNAAQADTNPGIPTVDHHVRVTEADFSGFTQITPSGAPGPSLGTNPMIGPNPMNNADTAPPVNITWDGHSANGSFLFDSGAQASFISSNMADQLHVHYKAGTYGTDNAELVDDNNNPIPNQFQSQLGGIGGMITVAGFYLNSLTLPTVEGDPLNYLGAPVLVADISAEDPTTGQTFTFDGDFGVNFWSASVGEQLASASPYSWVTYDPTNKLLGFEINPETIPEPASVWMLAVPLLFACSSRRRRQASSIMG